MTDEQPKSALPFYDCHKRVQAAKITKIEPMSVGVGLSFGRDADEDAPYGAVVDAAWVEKHQPVVGGYYVVYEDGYASFSPPEAFEGGYTAVGSEPKGAVIPAGTVVRVNAFPFMLVSNGVVEASQQHVDEQIREQKAFDGLPTTGSAQTAVGSPDGDQLEKFLGHLAGERLTLRVAPRHSTISPVDVRIASIDQTRAIEGTVRGNRFEPR